MANRWRRPGRKHAGNNESIRPAAAHLPVFLICGEADTTAPSRIGEAARKQLENAGALVDWNLLAKADHFDVIGTGAKPMAEWAAGPPYNARARQLRTTPMHPTHPMIRFRVTLSHPAGNTKAAWTFVHLSRRAR